MIDRFDAQILAARARGAKQEQIEARIRAVNERSPVIRDDPGYAKGRAAGLIYANEERLVDTVSQAAEEGKSSCVWEAPCVQGTSGVTKSDCAYQYGVVDAVVASLRELNFDARGHVWVNQSPILGTVSGEVVVEW
jgi:hypothetical protein